MSRRVLPEQNSRTALTLYDTNPRGEKLPQYTAALLATLGALSAGTFMSWSSPALPLLQDKYNHFIVTNSQASWIGSLMNLGAFLGALPAGFAADRFGRKKMLFVYGIPLVASWLLISFSDTVGEIYAGRILGGMAVGAVSVTVPMYIGELAEKHVRGALGAVFQLQITLGILLGYLAGMTGSVQTISLICCSVPVLYLLTYIWMPESPVYLVATNRKDDARKALKWFRGQHFDVEDELTRIEDTVQASQSNQEPVLTILKTRGVSKALIVSSGLMIFQQLSGVNAVIFYSGTIFDMVGGKLAPNLAAIVIGIAQVVATYASILLVDRAGRRILLLISSSVMAFSLCMLGIFFHLQNAGYDMTYFKWMPLVSLALFIIVFSLGLGPVPWLMLSELFPPEAKGAATAIAAACNWIFAFFVTLVFQKLMEFLGISGAFWTFSATCILATVFISVLVPETKGKDMEEIQAELCGRRRQSEQDSPLTSMKKRIRTTFSKPV